MTCSADLKGDSGEGGSSEDDDAELSRLCSGQGSRALHLVLCPLSRGAPCSYIPQLLFVIAAMVSGARPFRDSYIVVALPEVNRVESSQVERERERERGTNYCFI